MKPTIFVYVQYTQNNIATIIRMMMKLISNFQTVYWNTT